MPPVKPAATNEPPLILVCDHRGLGSPMLATGLATALATRGLWLQPSADLAESLAALAAARPALLVLDPLVEATPHELGALLAACSPAAGSTRPDRGTGHAQGAGALPVLFITASGELGAGGSALGPLSLPHGPALGPWDVIRRDASRGELVQRVERLLGEARRAAELEEMRYRALHDDRTDLLRPAAFQQRLEEHFSAAGRHGFELALLLVDLDDFGRVNKRFDHTVGDRVIASVGEAVRASLRAEDVAGRLGGDEFAVLLPYTGKLEAAHVVTRLRDEIHGLSATLAAEIAGADAGGEPLAISASIGFETYAGGDLASVDELRAHAEFALREAKRRGGNRGVYYRAT